MYYSLFGSKYGWSPLIQEELKTLETKVKKWTHDNILSPVYHDIVGKLKAACDFHMQDLMLHTYTNSMLADMSDSVLLKNRYLPKFCM